MRFSYVQNKRNERTVTMDKKFLGIFIKSSTLIVPILCSLMNESIIANGAPGCPFQVTVSLSTNLCKDCGLFQPTYNNATGLCSGGPYGANRQGGGSCGVSVSWDPKGPWDPKKGPFINYCYPNNNKGVCGNLILWSSDLNCRLGTTKKLNK